MPSYNKMLDLPEPGELWTNTLAGVDGIVVGHSGTVVTLVSLTGVRAPVEFNRSYNPWQKKLARPDNTQRCSRSACSNPAVVWYRRPMQTLPEAACPRHIPRGVVSEHLKSGQTVECSSAPAQTCPQCPAEAVEVLGEIENHVRDTTLWMCPPCGLWWVRTTRCDEENTNTYDTLKVVPPSYSFKSVLDSAHDPMAYRTTLRIRVLPKPSTVITGPKPMTLFDHLLREDD
jgi:hypothetical protein